MFISDCFIEQLSGKNGIMVTGIMDAFNYIAIGISIAGSIIIIWGALTTIFNLLVFEKNKIVNPKLPNGSEAIRHKFGAYLLLGLDFTLAADIIHTIHNPVVAFHLGKNKIKIGNLFNDLLFQSL